MGVVVDVSAAGAHNDAAAREVRGEGDMGGGASEALADSDAGVGAIVGSAVGGAVGAGAVGAGV